MLDALKNIGHVVKHELDWTGKTRTEFCKTRTQFAFYKSRQRFCNTRTQTNTDFVLNCGTILRIYPGAKVGINEYNYLFIVLNKKINSV